MENNKNTNNIVNNNKKGEITMKKITIVVEKETVVDINAEVVSTVKGIGTYCEVIDVSKVKCYTGEKNLRTSEAWNFPTDKVEEITFSRDVFNNLRDGYAAAISTVDDSVFERMNGKVLFCRPFQMHGLAKRLISLGFEITVPCMREKAISHLKATGKNVYEVTAYKQFFAHCCRTNKRFEDVRKQPYVIKDMLQYVGAGRDNNGRWVEGSYKAQILLTNEEVKFNRDATFIEVHGAVLKNWLVRAVCYFYVQADTEQAAMKVVDSWTKKVYGDKAIFSTSKKLLEGLVTRPMVKELTYKKILSSVAIETGNRFLSANIATTTTAVDAARIAELEAKVARLEQIVDALVKDNSKPADSAPVVTPTPEPKVTNQDPQDEVDDFEREMAEFAKSFNEANYTTTWDGRNPLPLGETTTTEPEPTVTPEPTVITETLVIESEPETVTPDEDVNADIKDEPTLDIPDVVVDDTMEEQVSLWLSCEKPNSSQVLIKEWYDKELADYEAKVQRGAVIATMFGLNGQKLRNTLKRSKVCRTGKIFDIKVENNKVMIVAVQNQPWQQLSFKDGKFIVG